MFINNVTYLKKKIMKEEEVIVGSLPFWSRTLRVRPRRGLKNHFYERGV